MHSSLKEFRSFVINQMIKGDWSTQGRTNYYTCQHVTIKKDFDTEEWLIALNEGSYIHLKEIGINKYFMFFLLFFIRRSTNKHVKDRNAEKILNEWTSFLKRNKDITRDKKIDKIIKND